MAPTGVGATFPSRVTSSSSAGLPRVTFPDMLLLTMETHGRTRAEIRRAYKEAPRRAGVYQIRNQNSGRVLLGSSTNLHGPLNKHRFMLSIGRHNNAALQEDWNRLGADAFTFEILEEVKPSQDPHFDLDAELTLLERIWLEKLGLAGERSYNAGPIQRD
jgi:hypothetical protein